MPPLPQAKATPSSVHVTHPHLQHSAQHHPYLHPAAAGRLLRPAGRLSHDLQHLREAVGDLALDHHAHVGDPRIPHLDAGDRVLLFFEVASREHQVEEAGHRRAGAELEGDEGGVRAAGDLEGGVCFLVSGKGVLGRGGGRFVVVQCSWMRGVGFFLLCAGYFCILSINVIGDVGQATLNRSRQVGSLRDGRTRGSYISEVEGGAAGIPIQVYQHTAKQLEILWTYSVSSESGTK